MAQHGRRRGHRDFAPRRPTSSRLRTRSATTTAIHGWMLHSGPTTKLINGAAPPSAPPDCTPSRSRVSLLDGSPDDGGISASRRSCRPTRSVVAVTGRGVHLRTVRRGRSRRHREHACAGPAGRVRAAMLRFDWTSDRVACAARRVVGRSATTFLDGARASTVLAFMYGVRGRRDPDDARQSSGARTPTRASRRAARSPQPFDDG